jgi:hypothetical protein
LFVPSIAELEDDRLVELLMEGASGVYLHEAPVRLVALYGYWLHDESFRSFLVPYGEPPEAIGIRWEDAVAALDRGEIIADDEETKVLRIAASICTPYRVILRECVEGLDADTVKHVAEAIMYADGYLSSTAHPAP